MFDFFTFIKLLPYWTGITFIKILRLSKLEFCGWPKNFRNSWNEVSRLAKILLFAGMKFRDLAKKLRTTKFSKYLEKKEEEV